MAVYAGAIRTGRLGLVVSIFHLSSWSEAQRTCLRPARSISTCRDRAILLEARFSTQKNCELVGNPSIHLEARLKLVGHPGFRPGFKQDRVMECDLYAQIPLLEWLMV